MLCDSTTFSRSVKPPLKYEGVSSATRRLSSSLGLASWIFCQRRFSFRVAFFMDWLIMSLFSLSLLATLCLPQGILACSITSSRVEAPLLNCSVADNAAFSVTFFPRNLCFAAITYTRLFKDSFWFWENPGRHLHNKFGFFIFSYVGRRNSKNARSRWCSSLLKSLLGNLL